jgi:putative acetyltransferase
LFPFRSCIADAPAILRVHVDSIRRVCSADYTSEQIEAWVRPKKLERYTRALERGDSMFVAVAGAGADERIIGFSSAQGDEVTGVYVAPDWLGRGAGRALLAALESDARARGITTMHLNSSLTAIRFYRAQGWQIVQNSTYRLSDSVEIACAKMSKAL